MPGTRTWLSAVGLTFLLAGTASAQQTDEGRTNDPATGLILGQIVDAYGNAVSGAVVTLNGGLRLIGNYTIQADELPDGPRRTVSTGNGHFLFTGLTQGAYSITAAKPGYEPGGFGRLRPEGTMQSLHLATGERRGGVTIRIWKLATITGTVIDEAGEPVVGTEVWALRRTYHTGHTRFETVTSRITTDDRGVYRLAGLTSGEYVVALATTRVTVPAPLIATIADARLNPEMMMSLPRISGLPIGFRPPSPGQRVGDWVLQGPASSRGEPVAPGVDAGGRMLVYPTLFYPSSRSLADAQVVTLASGDERSGMDLAVHVVSAANVSGVVRGPEGPMGNVSVRLVPAYAENATTEQNLDTAVSISNTAGEFLFLGVPAGNYVLRAQVSPTAGRPAMPASRMANARVRTLTANLPLTVTEEDVANLGLSLTGGFVIRGSFEFEGTTPKPAAKLLDGQMVMIQPLDGHMPGSGIGYYSDVQPDGSFVTQEIPPGRYVIRSATSATIRRAMETWIFKDVLLGGRDVARSPLDLKEDVSGLRIRFTDRPTEVSGLARNIQGAIDAEAAVLVISANPRDWTDFGSTPRRLRNIRAGLDGSYRVAGLPPGEYFVAAIPEAEAGDWHDPRVLQSAARIGVRVVLVDGQTTRQDVTTRSIR